MILVFVLCFANKWDLIGLVFPPIQMIQLHLGLVKEVAHGQIQKTSNLRMGKILNLGHAWIKGHVI